MDHLATKHGVWFHAGILHHAVLGRHARCKVRVRAARGTVHTDRLHQPPTLPLLATHRALMVRRSRYKMGR